MLPFARSTSHPVPLPFCTETRAASSCMSVAGSSAMAAGPTGPAAVKNFIANQTDTVWDRDEDIQAIR